MIAGQGIVRTGALEPIGRTLARMWLVSPRFTFLLMLLVCAWVSAFINNVPVVVLFLPILISVAVRTGIPTSSVLMPMGFATLLGGTSTTIGTSTNLLVVAVAEEMGLSRIGMFDFLLPAALAGTIGEETLPRFPLPDVVSGRYVSSVFKFLLAKAGPSGR